jgi:SAM-dependent MidA family methyltransferase
LPFDEVVDLALYHPTHGFYGRGQGAGRGRDFLTSPEVGPLFGAVLARALDRWWDELGRPDPFVVVEAGAGAGTLARAVLAAQPGCAPVMRYLAVERSAALRARHPAEVVSTAALPAAPGVGVVLANELLDNLPFRLLELTAEGWAEVKVGTDLAEVLVAAPSAAAVAASRLAPAARVGARIPIQDAARAWLARAASALTRGRVVVVDYAATTASMAERPWLEWVRTYRGHGRGGHPLTAVGEQDVTCEVAVDQLADVRPPTEDRSQADFLRAHGITEVADEAARAWQARAAIGDLQALKSRSRLHEADALTDARGLGGFRVLEWAQGR